MHLTAVASIMLASAASAATNTKCGNGIEIEAAFQAIQKAVGAKDLQALESLVHEQYVMNHGYGPSEPRSTWLSFVRQGTLARQTAEGLERDVRVRLFGGAGVRSWIVRLRRPIQKQETWLRGAATFVCQDDRWRMVQQQSTLLHEGPIVDAPDLSAFAGTYSVPNRPTFELADAGGYLALRWANGAEMPLIPLGSDRFVSAFGSTMVFQRDGAGHVVGATRLGDGGRELFRASRSK